MRRLELSVVKDGMVLARSLPSARRDGAPLLRAGTRLTGDLARRVGEAGNSAVWIDDELGNGVTPTPELPGDSFALPLAAVERALAVAPGALAARRPLDDRVLRDLQSAAGELADLVLEQPPDSCAVADLTIATATPTWHAVRVALLGTFIARRVMSQSGWIDHQGSQRFDSLDSRLAAVALGLLAHDLAVPTPSGHGPRSMTPEDDQPVTHASDGAALLPPESVPAAARVLVSQHHERWDGMGYPERKHQSQIAPTARIAAIADCFDALVAPPPGRAPARIDQAVGAIEGDAGSRFDPALVRHFAALVPRHPVGHSLTLPDGRTAVVTRQRPGHPRTPYVRVKDTAGALVEFVLDAPGPASAVA